MNITRELHKKFHIHAGDNLPYTSWLDGCNRNHIYGFFAEMGYKVGAEIGVRSGRNSEVMFKLIPDLKLYCIDPWGAYLRVSDTQQDRYYRWAQNRLAPYNATLIKKTSMDAVKDFEDEYLDFIYIDGRHDFCYVMEDLICWYPKLKKGAICSGHDFYNFYQGGVIAAVEAFTLGNNIKSWYITREKEPSFFWIKEQ